MLALALAAVIALVAIADTILKSFKGTTSFLIGPTNMALYVLDTTLTVLIHFFSTVLGRWTLKLKSDTIDVIDMAPMFLATMCLLWLLGQSAGVVNT